MHATDEGGVRSVLAGIEGWFRTADALLCGLNHTFSNRLASLAVISTWGAGDDGGATPLEAVATQSEQLADLLRLYRLLESVEDAPAEAARITDLVPDALALLAHHPTVRDVPYTVEGDTETPPVLLVPQALVQAIVLVLCAAAAQISPGDEATGIHLSYFGDPDWVTIAVETRAPAPVQQVVVIPELASLPWLLRAPGVTASSTRTVESGIRITLRLATMANLRRRERAS